MFNWFGRKSAPEAMACAHAPPPWLAGAGDEGFARGYEAQLSEVYRTNPVGLRSVRLVAGAIGGLVVESAGGEAGPAGAAASIHNRASRWNKALLDNAARPSGALSYEPGDGANLSGEQFDRLKAELAEQFAGATNAGRPLLLDGGLKWQAMALSPAEMDFVALKESAARDIALAFGVPPVLVGLPGDATYANAREAGRALYRQTVLPMAERILAELSALLSDWMGEVVLTIDTDQISELAEDRAKLWEQVRGADFLNEAEKRAMLGFDA
jgi:HK97 family phage portal protein